MPSGYEDALLEAGFERLAGDFLDDHAEHHGAGAVVPFVARIIHERQLPLVLFRRLFKPVLDRVESAVGDAGGMRQQMADRHRPLGRPCFVGCVLLVELRNDL